MPLIEWSDELSVGVKEFDAHHKKFIFYINRLAEVIAGDKTATAGEVLKELSAYREYHFSAEEAVLEKHHFPGLDRQREEHGQFGEDLECINEHFQNGDVIGKETLLFLKGWLFTHILKTDKEYTEYLKNRGVS